jgi:hypothetical protein
MNRITRIGRLAAYDEDFALWSAEQATLLRAGRLDGLDRENLAEEIESLGRSERYEIESRLKVLLVHLLKWRHQPQARSSGWKGSIYEQRVRIARRIRNSPSLRGYPADIMAEEYFFAVPQVADETGLAEDAFPATCPFTIEQILDPDFLPEAD